MRIQDRVFVVTGGGNGIGREVVLEILRRGGRVAAVDLRAEGLAETERFLAADLGVVENDHDVRLAIRRGSVALEPGTLGQLLGEHLLDRAQRAGD